MKKFFKVLFVSSLILAAVFFAVCGVFLLAPTKAELKEELLIISNDFANFYDVRNCLLESERNVLTIDEIIPDRLKEAIISSEDKNFYTHRGVDYPRIVKSALVNLRNGDFSQGASTISQQLIKNTHLTQEKTIKRKLKEIKLAQKLERTYSKDQILNMYLNTVYFGCNNYGIKDAARYYFSKDISELDTGECATLAGIIPSPANYNPVENRAVSEQKRNVVLSRMEKNGYISTQEKEQLSALDIQLNLSERSGVQSPYKSECLKEIYDSTDLTPYDLASANIFTYYDDKLQNVLVEAKTEDDRDHQSIVIDNETLGVKAYYTTCGAQPRSPASTIKPLLVYAPALEVGAVHEMTKIRDEPTVFGGFEAKNYKDKYYGEVSMKFALANSLNVPAVTLYNSLGKEKCNSFMNKLGIYDDNDNYDLALGRFDGGVTIKSLVAAYAVFPNGGKFQKAKFVKKITDKFGKTVYSATDEQTKVFSEGTAAIICDALNECVKSGTAKKLSGKDYEVCAKTGTGGNENGNVDAIVAAYTSEHTLCVWSGYADSRLMDNSVTGATSPCVSASYILDELYKDKKPNDIIKNGIVKLRIDKSTYDEKGEFLLAPETATDRSCYEFLFDERYAPEKKIEPIKPSAEKLKIEEKKNKIRLKGDKGFFIRVEKLTAEGIAEIYDGTIEGFSDDSRGGDAVYYITPYIKTKNDEIIGETIVKTVGGKKKSSESIPSEWWRDRE